MFTKQEGIKLTLLSLLTAIMYIPTFAWMVERWTVADTYYSHGFLVPLISGIIVWQKRKELANIKPEGISSGWLFFIFGILIHLISAAWEVYFSSGFSLLLVLTGLILLFFGREFLRKILFALLFLIFMIPLPMVLISNLSFRLKILASQISVFIVKNLFGMPVIREGSVIKTAQTYLVVEDPCSGIRSLIALIALGVLMAYFSKLTKSKKIILFLSSIPIALLSNIFRIVVLILVSEIYGAQVATGKFHDVMGILVFVFAFLGLASVQKLLEQYE